MAKHRRLSSKRASRKPIRPTGARVVTRARTAAPAVGSGARVAAPSDAHIAAVRVYEHGVEALQQHDYARAAQLLESVIDRYPDEKELHERVRLYLNVCRRHAAPPDHTPRTPAERVYAATLAINAGVYDHGLRHLQLALEAEPANDHVHYMLGVVHALRQNFASSLAHLQRAVELNPENRFLALQDADLAALRETDPRFRTTIDAAFTARRERRDGHRPRTSR
jgi:tetratricopeptide (TPR) repeat protein